MNKLVNGWLNKVPELIMISLLILALFFNQSLHERNKRVADWRKDRLAMADNLEIKLVLQLPKGLSLTENLR